NVVVFADISESRSRLAGFIPTGAYPTAVKMLADGRVGVVNGGGSLSFLDPITDETLNNYTRTVVEITPYRDAILSGPAPQKSSIEHVVYVVSTGQKSVQGTNQKKLAIEFVRYDNFHVVGGSSIAAHDWAFSAIASDFTRRLPGRESPKEPASL